ncbi:MAG: S-layer homology domain-containing protein [Armatimonadetes bacterium]|nr:S-layer homology domain-containing protein [Armatimonadota bacterium]
MRRMIVVCLALPLLGLGAGLARAQAAPPPKQVVVQGHVIRGTPFPDVPKNHWAYQAVEALRQAGIITGEPAPGKSIRRPKARHAPAEPAVPLKGGRS